MATTRTPLSEIISVRGPTPMSRASWPPATWTTGRTAACTPWPR